MNDAIRRRGPDGAGHFVSGPVALAMRRLAIIDLDGGKQPIFNEDGSVAIVFNGEIYNYRQLRRTLIERGHAFKTESDTEVIVHLYEEHGLEAPKFLTGMFAFALWDRARQRLVIARDRFGIKPLYFTRTPSTLAFASEIKSVLAHGAARTELDLQAVDEYLTYTNIPTPRTIYKNVVQLPPGSVMCVEANGDARITPYWSIPESQPHVLPEAEWVEQVQRAFRSSVERHLVSDVPVGAFLSGGVDSGLMVAMMADLLGPNVQTFTIGFKDAGAAFIDERKYSRALAERYGLKYHEIEVTPRFDDIASELASAFDQPFADDSTIPTYYICKAASEHVKVALTGLGGDELFAGYRRHLGLSLAEQYARLPSWISHRVIAPAVRALPDSANSSDAVDHLKRFIRAQSAEPAERYADYLSSLPWHERSPLYTPEFRQAVDPRTTLDVVKTKFDAGAHRGLHLDRALRTDLAMYLVDDVLTLSDRLSMWHSLELRVPFVDHELLDLTSSIPANLKIRRLTQKYVLKKVAERWLPREMIYHKKQGFEAPMGRWLRGPLLPFFDSVVNEAAVEASGIFNFAAIQRIRREHVERIAKHSKVMFSIMSFMLWQQSRPAA